MTNRYTLAAAAMLMAGVASATNYFFSPAGAGEKDASSWENAGDNAALVATIKAMQPNDTLCMAADTFYPTGGIDISQGVTIKGGFTAELQTGTNTEINYNAVQARTILNGENTTIGNRSFIVIGKNGDALYDAFQKTTLAGLEIVKMNVTRTNVYSSAVILGYDATFELDHVDLYNNVCAANGGSITIHGCYAYVHDCIIRDNTTNGVGAAFHARSHNSKTDGSTPGSVAIIDRCLIMDNIVANASANYGGAMALADYGGTMYINNCTITGTDIGGYGGGALRAGGHSYLVTTNSTFYNCASHNTAKKNQNGEMLSIGTSADYKTANTICVNKEDGKSGVNSMICLQNSNTFASGGHNIFGSFNTTDLAASDNVANTNTSEVVFGAKDVEPSTSESGMVVFKPLDSYRGVKTNDIVEATSAWNLPAELDLTKDQLGNVRPDITIPGAYDFLAKVATGIESAAVADTRMVLRRIADGVFAIEGADAIEAYDLAGRRVATARGAVIDLSSSAAGVYIVRAGNNAAKIVR